MVVKEKKNSFKVKVFDLTFTIQKVKGGYEIDENSTLWINYRSNYFLPGIQLKRTKADKMCPNFDWKKYSFARLYFKEGYNLWAIYGTRMENREILFEKVCYVGRERIIGAFGLDWEEIYWEKVYQC